jgi:hypothetical protein
VRPTAGEDDRDHHPQGATFIASRFVAENKDLALEAGSKVNAS